MPLLEDSSANRNWNKTGSKRPISTVIIVLLRNTCPSHCRTPERCLTNCRTRRMPRSLSLSEVMARRANCALGSSGNTASSHHTHAGPFGEANMFGSHSGKSPKCCIIRACGACGSPPNQSRACLCTSSWSANNSENKHMLVLVHVIDRI